MLMIPATFMPAAGLAVLAIWLLMRFPEPIRMPWLIAFLASLALQLTLLGTRHGYGVDSILNIQHLTGVLIAPLAWLAFKNPPLSRRIAVHIIPVIVIALVLYLAIDFADLTLALITFGYAVALSVARSKGDDLLSWAPLRINRILKTALWTTVVLLVFSGITDLTIAADFLATGGTHIASIIAAASIAGIALLAAGMFFLIVHGRHRQPAQNAAGDKALVERLSAELERDDLFRDPDLTLRRLARRLGVPSRQISEAVNRNCGVNMSQFVNNHRISAACQALAAGDMSITAAMFDAGFLTKSNFNREFRRVTGKTPTKWRAENRNKSESTGGS